MLRHGAYLDSSMRRNTLCLVQRGSTESLVLTFDGDEEYDFWLGGVRTVQVQSYQYHAFMCRELQKSSNVVSMDRIRRSKGVWASLNSLSRRARRSRRGGEGGGSEEGEAGAAVAERGGEGGGEVAVAAAAEAAELRGGDQQGEGEVEQPQSRKETAACELERKTAAPASAAEARAAGGGENTAEDGGEANRSSNVPKLKQAAMGQHGAGFERPLK